MTPTDQADTIQTSKEGTQEVTVPDFLTLSDIARILDVKPASARVYHEVAQRNRREEQIRPTDMPEPYTRIGRTPVWTQASIDEWMKRRTPRRRVDVA